MHFGVVRTRRWPSSCWLPSNTKNRLTRQRVPRARSAMCLKRTEQRSLFELEPVAHPVAAALEAISAWLDEHPELPDAIVVDLAARNGSIHGRHGVSGGPCCVARCSNTCARRRGVTRPVAVRLKIGGNIHIGAARSYVEQECQGAVPDMAPGHHRREGVRRPVDRIPEPRCGGLPLGATRRTHPDAVVARRGTLGRVRPGSRTEYSSTADKDQARRFEVVDRARYRVDSLRTTDG